MASSRTASTPRSYDELVDKYISPPSKRSGTISQQHAEPPIPAMSFRTARKKKRQTALTKERWLDHSHYEDAVEGFHVYDPSSWKGTINFSMSAFILPPLAMITGFSLILTVLSSTFDSFDDLCSMPMDAHVVLGGALSFLVVFRTNSSYDRWWEARKEMQNVVNACRSHATAVASSLKSHEATEEVCTAVLQYPTAHEQAFEPLSLTSSTLATYFLRARHQVFELLILFFVALKSWLRDEKIKQEELGGRMSWKLVRSVSQAACPPLACVHMIGKVVRTSLPEDDKSTENVDESQINAAIFVESTEIVRSLVASIGACERIKTTPMTFGYVSALRSFLVLWLATLPFVLIGEYGMVATPAIAFIAFLFLAMEQMAIEIEQPFGDDPNDLPIESYILDLERTLHQMLPGTVTNESEDDEDDTDPPAESVKDEAKDDPFIAFHQASTWFFGRGSATSSTSSTGRGDKSPPIHVSSRFPLSTMRDERTPPLDSSSSSAQTFFPSNDPLADPLKGWRPGSRLGSRLALPDSLPAGPLVDYDVLAQTAGPRPRTSTNDAHDGQLGA